MLSKRRLALALTLAGVALLAACNSGANPAETPAGSATPALPILTQVTREKGGVRITLSVDKEKYKPDEKVEVRAEAANISGGPLAYGSGAPGQPLFALAVTSELAGVTLLNPGATAPAAGGNFAAGGTVKAETEWDQELPIPQTPVAAPPGKYTATAELALAGAEAGADFSVSASVTFELEGGEPVALPQDAMKSVLSSDPVKAWFAGRNPTPVCAYPGRGLFYLGSAQSGQVNESLDVMYNANRANGYAICSILTSEEGWWLLFYSKDGPPPNRIMAWAGLHDGAFIRMEEGGPTPVPATPGATPAGQ